MIFTKEIEYFISKNYIGIKNAELAAKVNKEFDLDLTPMQVSSFKRRKGYNSGLTGQFPKGYDGGSFNCKPIGSIRYDRSGYSMTKIKERNGNLGYWEYTHILLWEKFNGKLPENKKLMFLDGDINNITLSNLMLVSNRELNVMNAQKLRSNIADITKVSLVIAKLNIAVKDRERKK